MQRLKWIFALVVALAGLIANFPGSGAGTDPEKDAAMAAWARAMVPGPPHAALAEMAGEWRYVVTFWHEPGAEPSVVEGLALKTMIMGGRFLEEEITGDFMGRPFKGYGVTGYDNVTKEYVSIWLDNASTGIGVSTGRETAPGVRTYTSTMHDPATGKPIRTRSIGRGTDRDHHTFENYLTRPDGSEFLHMRVEYTRVTG